MHTFVERIYDFYVLSWKCYTKIRMRSHCLSAIEISLVSWLILPDQLFILSEMSGGPGDFRKLSRLSRENY